MAGFGSFVTETSLALVHDAPLADLSLKITVKLIALS